MSCPILQNKYPVFFWRETEQPYGFLSQWFHAPFTAPGFEIDSPPIYFQNAEQYMMYRKATLFQDHKTAAQILEAVNPATQKSLGRTVRGFDKATWDNQKETIVEEGNWYKFSTTDNFGLKKLLLETGDRDLVEASPFDRIWGIGYGAATAESNRDRWGENLLGKALGRVRSRLRAADYAQVKH